jgi:hypothetical protein
MAGRYFDIDAFTQMCNDGDIPPWMNQPFPSMHESNFVPFMGGFSRPSRDCRRPVIVEVDDNNSDDSGGDGCDDRSEYVSSNNDLSIIYNEIRSIRSEILDVKLMLLRLLEDKNKTDSHDDTSDDDVTTSFESLRVNELYSDNAPISPPILQNSLSNID